MAADVRTSSRPSDGETFDAARQRLMSLFRAAGLDTPGLDARRLIAACCGVAPGDILRDPNRSLTTAEACELDRYVARRLAREPVSRIVGRRGFHGLDLAISPATLDPRPETETLVDGVIGIVLRGAAPGGKAPRILDLGTGSGAIILALLEALPDATGLATDLSAEALALASHNATRLSLEARCAFRRSNWLDGITETFDLIVANPPYIPTADLAALDDEVKGYDPHTALDGGPDGIGPYRHIFAAAPYRLRPGGWLVAEMGYDQGDMLCDLWRTLHPAPIWNVEVWPDMAGKPRCVAIQHQLAR